MKKALLFITIRLTAVIILISGFTAYGQILLKQNGQNGITVTQDNFSGISFTNTLTSINQISVNTDKGVFTEISADGYGYSNEQGYPKLPVMRKLIEIPEGASLDVEIVSYDVTEYVLGQLGISNRIIPAQAPLVKSNTGDVPLLINTKVYNNNRYYGKKLASAEILGHMRGTRLARIDVSPVEYNPVSGSIKVYDNLVVNIRFRNGDAEVTRQLKEKTRSPYFKSLEASFLNKLPVTGGNRENFARYPIKYVIVSDPMFHDALQPLIEWKTRKGFTVIEAYTNDPAVGTTTTSIKNYLQGLYNAGTPEDPAPTFVLFVGDVAQIPAYNGTANGGGHVTDLYYCEYTNDHIPEMFYGRFSATNLTQLQPQIDKTLMYEQYLFPDPSFLGECVMISGVDAGNAPTYGNGQINYGTSNYFNEAHNLLSHTYLYPASQGASSAIIQNVSDGLGYGNYTAHGSSSGWADPSFEISDIPGLQNDGKYPLLVGNCCLTSTYNTNCFGEELLRAANKGAVGYIGGSNSTYWDEDYFFGIGVGPILTNPTYEQTTLGNYDRAFHDHGEPQSEWFTSQGEMLFAGNFAVTESGSSLTNYYWEIYCLMGDPSLMIYFGVPDAMNVTYDPLMPLSTTEFTVSAVPYALVAISKDGVLYGSGVADETGVAVVSLNPITVPGDAEIIVTAQNKQPYIGYVIVASPDGAYILLDSQEVNDVNANNNHVAEYAESFGFTMALKNVGNTAGANLTATLSCNSPYIEIKNGTETWPNIDPGAIVTKDYAFEATASSYLPDQTPAVFTIEVTDGTDVWSSSFTIKLNAPRLETMPFTINDAAGGNGNGRLDPGETAQITIPVDNTGHCTALQTVAHLFSDSEGVSIAEEEFNIGDLNTISTGNAVFDVTVSPDIAVGTTIDLYFVAVAGLYNTTEVLMPSVGLIIEDFETGDFSAYNWDNTSAIPWTITTTSVNSGTYAARSGAISDNGSTSLQIAMDVASAGDITFARRVSSESGYDYLKFYIDNSEKGSWSGDVAWSTVSYPVTQGTHTFKWTYSKDNSVSSGSDAGFIDDIIFPSGNSGGSSTDLTVKAFAYPAHVCSGGSSQLFAFVTNATTDVAYAWTPEDLLSDETVFNPIATLVESTTFDITVTSFLASDNTQVTVDVMPAPETPVITQNLTQLISSATEGNQWYNSQGAIEGAVNQIYEPEVSDYYHVVVTSEAGCASDPSNQIYMTVTGTENLIAENSLSIYPNPFHRDLHISYNLIKNGPVRISLLNLLGQETMLLSDQESVQSGAHSITVAPALKPGVYFIKLQSNDFTTTRKVILSE